MAVYFNSVVTRTPDRWNRSQPISLLIYIYELAVNRTVLLVKEQPLTEFEFQMLQVQMSSLPHSPPMMQLPAIQWNRFFMFVACISWCTFLWTRCTMLLVVVWENKKIERFSGKLEVLPHMSTETRAGLLLQPLQSFYRSVGKCCGYVKGGGHTSDSQGR